MTSVWCAKKMLKQVVVFCFVDKKKITNLKEKLRWSSAVSRFCDWLNFRVFTGRGKRAHDSWFFFDCRTPRNVYWLNIDRFFKRISFVIFSMDRFCCDKSSTLLFGTCFVSIGMNRTRKKDEEEKNDKPLKYFYRSLLMKSSIEFISIVFVLVCFFFITGPSSLVFLLFFVAIRR